MTFSKYHYRSVMTGIKLKEKKTSIANIYIYINEMKDAMLKKWELETPRELWCSGKSIAPTFSTALLHRIRLIMFQLLVTVEGPICFGYCYPINPKASQQQSWPLIMNERELTRCFCQLFLLIYYATSVYRHQLAK